MEMGTHTFRMLIGGRLCDAPSSMEVVNPATESPFAHAPDCSQAQLNEAITAARHAFTGWRKTTWSQRAAALRDMAQCIETDIEMLTLLLTREQGKPLVDARGEITRAAQWMRRTAEFTLDDSVRRGTFGRTQTLRYTPLGVVAAIAPWNFPVTLAIFKLAPALLTGNTVVAKPSPFTPLTLLRIGELVRDVLPPGVLNIVSGGDALGPWLTEHPGIDKIAFTGSTQTGRAIMRSAASTLKRLTLELGGNDAAIVLPDADLSSVTPKLFWAALRNAGQLCVAAKRIYVHESIYDRLLEGMARFAQENPPMSGESPDAKWGPVQNRIQYARVTRMIDAVRAAGGCVVQPEVKVPERGYFIPATLVDDPPDDWPIVREEPFGPVVPLLRYRDIDAAIERANASEYGLGGSVWGADEERAMQVAARLETGNVWINSGYALDPDTPFGGHKQSGVGFENGPEGLLQYTNTQVISVA